MSEDAPYRPLQSHYMRGTSLQTIGQRAHCRAASVCVTLSFY